MVAMCTKFGETVKYFFRYWAETILNDLHDIKNKAKVTQCKLGLRLNLVILYTKFGEDTSNISSDIELYPFWMVVNDICDLQNKFKVTRF